MDDNIEGYKKRAETAEAKLREYEQSQADKAEEFKWKRAESKEIDDAIFKSMDKGRLGLMSYKLKALVVSIEEIEIASIKAVLVKENLIKNVNNLVDKVLKTMES